MDLPIPDPQPNLQPTYQRGYHLDLYLRFRSDPPLEIAKKWVQDLTNLPLEPSWYLDLAQARAVRLLGDPPPDLALLLEGLKTLLFQIKSCELGLRPVLQSMSSNHKSTEYLPWTRNMILKKNTLENAEILTLELGVRYIFED
jgi:hypothetical protein